MACLLTNQKKDKRSRTLFKVVGWARRVRFVYTNTDSKVVGDDFVRFPVSQDWGIFILTKDLKELIEGRIHAVAGYVLRRRRKTTFPACRLYLPQRTAETSWFRLSRNGQLLLLVTPVDVYAVSVLSVKRLLKDQCRRIRIFRMSDFLSVGKDW